MSETHDPLSVLPTGATPAQSIVRAPNCSSEVTVDGRSYFRDGKGRLTPSAIVKIEDKLEDELVYNIMAHADALNAQIARFKGHCFDDIGAFLELGAEKYNVTRRGGVKGNMSFTSYDGLRRITVKIADQMKFGSQLQQAKVLIDECIAEWAADANDFVRALINLAFEPQKEGNVNREALFSLRKIKIDDPRWIKAMEAINDSIRIEGSKTYLNFHRRKNPADKWEHVSIDLASADAPKGEE